MQLENKSSVPELAPWVVKSLDAWTEAYALDVDERDSMRAMLRRWIMDGGQERIEEACEFGWPWAFERAQLDGAEREA